MIIYTYPIETAFIKRDVEMLSPQFKIKTLEFTDDPLRLPFYFILQFFQLLFYLPRTSHYLCFFGGYHSVLPVMFGKISRKKVYIQCGGTDAMHMPEINYGNYRKKWLRESTIFSFRNCTKILPVAKALIDQEYKYSSIIAPDQGIKNLVPYLTTPIEVIHNGFDSQYWVDKGAFRAENSFITVATGTSKLNRAIIKGMDLLEQMAEAIPDASFTIIGDSDYSSTHSNVKVIGKLSQEELLDMYNSHQFYLQLSMSEGFPNSLAEAMLCGCIPIGTAVGAIPEIIGDAGFLLEKKDTALLLRLVETSKKANLQALRILAPFRIKSLYNYEDRKNALLSLFK
ncbi:glycosyltransferase family 4 protein [Anditalea andensis]|uniref:Glycosyltransferase n=1 Tax=Anditalea andensis TaxID=1048983 RepID=A0A074KTY1_9BACT|nr:glycosyltransferase family 4 protein [Anditalea andensis]KEO72374.1 glycosyltransferase [Anditalea andensis]